MQCRAFETAVRLAEKTERKKFFFECELGGLFTADPAENSLAALLRIIGFDEVCIVALSFHAHS
jgi:hypothetical protein